MPKRKRRRVPGEAATRAGMPLDEAGTAAGAAGTNRKSDMRYDYSQVAGIRNPVLRVLAAMAIVASPVLGAFVFVVLFALAYTVGR